MFCIALSSALVMLPPHLYIPYKRMELAIGDRHIGHEATASLHSTHRHTCPHGMRATCREYTVNSKLSSIRFKSELFTTSCTMSYQVGFLITPLTRSVHTTQSFSSSASRLSSSRSLALLVSSVASSWRLSSSCTLSSFNLGKEH